MNAHAATSLTILPALGRLDALLARAAGITNERLSTSSDESNESIIDGVRRLLDRPPGEPGFATDEPLSPFPSNGNRFATIADVCNLADFDLDVVVLALAPELDRRYERLYAWLQQDSNEWRPTVNLALDLFCCDATARIEQRARFGAGSPLIRSRAIELSGNGTLLSRVIRLDEQLVRYLTGDDGLDARLDGFAGITRPDESRTSAGFAPETLDALSRLKSPLPSPARLSFEGPNRAGAKEAAETIASAANRSLLTVDCRAMLKQGADTANLFPIIFREARFRNAVLLLTGVDHLDDDVAARDRLDDELVSSRGVTILASDQPLRAGKRPLGIVAVPFPMPPAAVRQSLWTERFTAAGVRADVEAIDALADSFRLDADAMDDVALTLANSRSMTGVAPDRNEIFRVARAHSGRDLAGYATRVAPSHCWDDLILDGETLEQLRDVQNRVLHRRRVLAEWGFARLLPRGRGISVLFSGPSGTGKTMAAEVIASELGLDLYRIDLATVVSKYIGETEKNLEAIFNAAADANGILLFDEADAIFGRRSEVKDAHDRYANLEISYLLQKMEQFDGVAILATNLRDHLDDAFLRRLQIVVEFRLPDEELRERMWRAFFPNEVPLDRAIDFSELARQFRLSGGNIKNIAVAAAYGAAANGGVVDGGHVLYAARREHQKIGRRLHLAEFDEAATGSRG